MSYESKGFWVIKNNENASEEEGQDSVYNDHHPQPRDDAKRPHHPWFGSETFPNKKQAVLQDPGKSNVVGLPLWETSSVFQSVSNQFMDRLLGTEMPRPLLFGDTDSRTEPKSYMEGRSVELSISNDVEVGFGGDGGRKLQVSRVKETMNGGLRDGRKIESSSSSIRACGRENESSSFVNFAMEGGGHPYGNEDDDAHGITFGELNGVDSASNVVGNYQSYVQDPDMVYGQETAQQNSSEVVSEQQQVANKQSLEALPKSKTSTKKEASTSFPSNVRSLISTGMLDGVPVKYVALSREELRGVIKGSGYLCGCQACDYTKVLNAYAFERHAGCKTKHPNNHIYFENGKTIYQIVQELRNTPETMLFDVVQTVFGSPINQKAFRIWKESFQAATRELQRIYGKEERCF
ncbi:DNA-binding protein [Hirschfeldia incana]|nr:DNA-binding protein [Hirschfeldia incana]